MREKVRWCVGRITQKGWTKMVQNAIWGSGVELKSTEAAKKRVDGIEAALGALASGTIRC